MEPITEVNVVATFGGATTLVFVVMAAFGKPILRRLLKLPPKGSEQPDPPETKRSYSILMNATAVVLGVFFVLGATAIVNSGLTATLAANAALTGFFAGLAGTGVSEVWGNGVSLIQRK
jgi:hypothetical protein